LPVVLSTTIQSPSNRSGRHLQRREKLSDGGGAGVHLSALKKWPRGQSRKRFKQPGSTGPKLERVKETARMLK
jgi:hypothetical protein